LLEEMDGYLIILCRSITGLLKAKNIAVTGKQFEMIKIIG